MALQIIHVKNAITILIISQKEIRILNDKFGFSQREYLTSNVRFYRYRLLNNHKKLNDSILGQEK